MEANADNLTGTARDTLKASADATRAVGEVREEAIGDAGVDAHAMSNEHKASMINGNWVRQPSGTTRGETVRFGFD